METKKKIVTALPCECGNTEYTKVSCVTSLPKKSIQFNYLACTKCKARYMVSKLVYYIGRI